MPHQDEPNQSRKSAMVREPLSMYTLTYNKRLQRKDKTSE